MVWGEDRVSFYDGSGQHQSLPTAWTDLGEHYLFVCATGGRSWFRVRDLLELVRLVDALRQRGKAADRA